MISNGVVCADGAGASDDGAGCAVLLETMRALAAGAAPRHDAVFLFNAAEENVLQASHGFITQHKYACRVYYCVMFGTFVPTCTR